MYLTGEGPAPGNDSPAPALIVPGGKPLDYLERVRERFPLVMHGVSLSIGRGVAWFSAKRMSKCLTGICEIEQTGEQ